MPNCGEQEAIATAIEGRTGSSGVQCFSYSCPPAIFNPPKPVDPCELGMPNCGEQEAIATAIEGRTGSRGEQCFSYSCPPAIFNPPKPVDPCELGMPNCGEQEAIATRSRVARARVESSVSATAALRQHSPTHSPTRQPKQTPRKSVPSITKVT